jgi:hypothetical protein
MKVTYIFLLLTLNVFSQTGSVKGVIVSNEYNLPEPGLVLELYTDEKLVYGTQTDIDGNYHIKDVPLGNYKLKISSIGYRNKFIANFVVEEGIKRFDFAYPDPCIIAKKICPKGKHTDNIIPIIYGFPSEKAMKRAKRGKVMLGGCDPSYCEKWHCKTHDLSF